MPGPRPRSAYGFVLRAVGRFDLASGRGHVTCRRPVHDPSTREQRGLVYRTRPTRSFASTRRRRTPEPRVTGRLYFELRPTIRGDGSIARLPHAAISAARRWLARQWLGFVEDPRRLRDHCVRRVTDRAVTRLTDTPSSPRRRTHRRIRSRDAQRSRSSLIIPARTPVCRCAARTSAPTPFGSAAPASGISSSSAIELGRLRADHWLCSRRCSQASRALGRSRRRASRPLATSSLPWTRELHERSSFGYESLSKSCPSM